MADYNHRQIEAKWRRFWQEQNLYAANNSQQPKFYCLDMFPYPSGTGLHVGHPKGYIATDIIARRKLMEGYNVLHPMGWDAFGLPAENYAIKNKVHPAAAVAKNIDVYKKQLEILGLAYDWSKEVNTTDPHYYAWTQWMFAEMFKRGLVYESNEPINWCPTCQTGLANEDLEDGRCERCGSLIERKPLRQWVIRITDYAQRLLDDLELLPEWEDSIKEMQRHWLGRSEGAVVCFDIKTETDSLGRLEVFTTRPDTLFGATYLVLSPEHVALTTWQAHIDNYDEVVKYAAEVRHKSDLERTDLNKDKTGVKLLGLSAVNPVNGAALPVFVADYVLSGYGSGAIMAVPAHDQRDWDFAIKYDLPIKTVVQSLTDQPVNCFSGIGRAINSDFLDGLGTDEAKAAMIDWLEDKNLGQRQVNWRLRDWVFSRQRYWGEPIPLVFCEHCRQHPLNDGERLNPGWLVDERLPVELPAVESYEPAGDGQSPLAGIEQWVNCTCPRCGGPARRETNTMPQWAGSSWYYAGYVMKGVDQALALNSTAYSEALRTWLPVDLYVGGAEHATRHLIYARFWHKFLYDIGLVATVEPFNKLRHVGLILAEDGRKMSKRWNNVINPDDMVDAYGADALRIYEMFMGPFEQAVAWNTNGVVGAKKFLNKLVALSEKVVDDPSLGATTLSLLHKTIVKVSADIDNFKFNTAVSSLMILVNALSEASHIGRQEFIEVLRLVAPFAPHLSEELYQRLGCSESIFSSSWPKAEARLLKDEQATIAVQINGKLRSQINAAVDLPQEELLRLAQADVKSASWLKDKVIVKVVVVPNRLLNIVTD